MIKKDAQIIDFNEERAKRLEMPPLALSPIDPDDPNWLSKLEVGTVFLCFHKGNNTEFTLPEFALKHKTNKTVVLLQVGPDGSHFEVPVEPYKFCRRFGLHEVLLTAAERDLILQRNQQEKGITVEE